MIILFIILGLVSSFNFNKKPLKINNIGRNSLNEVNELTKQLNGYGYLSTLGYSNKLKGIPQTSLIGFCIDENKYPLVSMANISMHYRNIQKNNSVSLLITEPTIQSATQKRVLFTGNLNEIKDNELDHYKELYKKYHTNAYWIDYIDFNFYRMDEILQIFYVGGFSSATQISISKYLSNN
jgi:hypothetical protein